MTQREFRRRRGEQWSPSFIARIGKLASKLYREMYKEEPPYQVSDGKHEPVSIYPRGILDQAYRRLIKDGVTIGKPYIQPDPTLKSSKLEKRPAYPPAVHPGFSIDRERFMGILRKIVAQRLADAAAGKLPDEVEPDDDGYTGCDDPNDSELT